MDTLDERDLQVHVTILGWVLIVGQGILLLVAGFVFILLTGIGMISQDRQAISILSTVAVLVAGFLAVLAVPGLVAGIGLLARKSWARILALVVGVLGIVNFPIGTVIGLYTFWVLLQRDADAYFRRASAETTIRTPGSPG